MPTLPFKRHRPVSKLIPKGSLADDHKKDDKKDHKKDEKKGESASTASELVSIAYLNALSAYR